MAVCSALSLDRNALFLCLFRIKMDHIPSAGFGHDCIAGFASQILLLSHVSPQTYLLIKKIIKGSNMVTRLIVIQAHLYLLKNKLSAWCHPQ